MGSQVPPADSALFKPLRVGHCALQHRVALAPLTRYRNSDDDHVPLPLMEKYYADRGCVPGTLVISEATAVAHSEEGHRNGPGIVSDAQVEGWRRVIRAVHDNGSFFFQQIWAMGRAVDPTYVRARGHDVRSSGAVPMAEGAPAPRAMTEDEILQVIADFAETARRVVAAGGDGVEIHSAHGYLLDQFLTEGVNTRTDRWGGSVENRARLTLEVVRAVCAAVGPERVAIRLSPWAGFQGSEKADVVPLYTHIIDELRRMDVSLAYLSLVEARGDPGELVLGSDPIHVGRTLDFILDRWANRSPVVVAGAFTPDAAAHALATRYARWDTLVAFGRYFISNPDLVYRIRHGVALTPYNRATFYLNKQWKGYNDQPFSDEFARDHPDIANKHPTPPDQVAVE